jgi:acyl-CoA reductase-like NAD-dependent aldehyde dehydrogenase
MARMCQGPSGQSAPVFNPSTGEPSGIVGLADIAEVDRVVASAKAAGPELAPGVAVDAVGSDVRVPGTSRDAR